MKRSSLLFTSGALFVTAVAGCQVIGGIQSWSADPVPPVGVCNLPRTGDGLVRLVNVANVNNAGGSTSTDFCIRPSGTSDWGRPIFRDGGQDTFCSGGLPYLQATMPFHVPVGSIDVKAIPAGETCAAAATSEKDGIAIATAGPDPSGPLQMTTLLRYAGGEATSPEAIAALPEEPGQFSGGSTNLRVVNALSGGQSINFGLAPNGATSLPTTLVQEELAAPIPPGAVPPQQQAGVGPVDAEGYLRTLNSSFTWVAALANDETQAAVALLQLPAAAVTASLFVVGDPSSKNSFPVRGLYCQDRFAAATDAGPPGFSPADVSELEDCTLTPLPTLSFDTWDVGLAGANTPFPASRTLPVQAAIAARASTTDVICITEVDALADRNAMIAAAAGFPYSYEIDTTVSTQPDDPTEADGAVPPAPTGPPCAAPVSGAAVSKAYSCIAQNCTAPSDAGIGPLDQSTNCVSDSCVLDLTPLYSAQQSSPQQTANDVCFDCMLLNMLDPTETLPAGQATCTGSTQPAFMYQGQTPLLILSKYPFNSKTSYNYPSTGIRRGILKVQVQFEDDLALDVFCTQLASPQLDSSLPYVGNYGRDAPSLDGGPGENGWADEQELQAKRAVSWIQSQVQADGVPAVIMGTFYSTIGLTTPADDAGGLATGTLSPLVMQTLDQSQGGAFPRAEPDGYVRVCDTCPGNPYTPGHAPLEFEPMFLAGFPPGQSRNWTASETVWATNDSAVTLTSTAFEQAPPGNVGPLSEYYAHNWQIFRPPSTAGSSADAGNAGDAAK